MSGQTARFHFTRAQRLRSSKEFRAVQSSGRRWVSASFIVLAARATGGDVGRPPRLGVTVSRKVGNAVVRNRVKRVVREWFRTRDGQIPARLDVVVIARSAAARRSSSHLQQELDEILERMAR